MIASGEYTVLREALGRIRNDGVFTLGAKIARRLGNVVLRTNSADWYYTDLSQAADYCTVSRQEAVVDFNATKEVIAWLRQIRGEFPWAWVQEELDIAREYNHVFARLRMGEEAVGYVKIGLTRSYVTDFARCIAVPEASAYIYDTFVHPERRGRGLATFLLLQTQDFLRRQNTRFVWSHIPRWNHASIGAYRRAGFAEVKHVRYVRFMGLRLFSHHPERLMRCAEDGLLRSLSRRQHEGGGVDS